MPCKDGEVRKARAREYEAALKARDPEAYNAKKRAQVAALKAKDPDAWRAKQREYQAAHKAKDPEAWLARIRELRNTFWQRQKGTEEELTEKYFERESRAEAYRAKQRAYHAARKARDPEAYLARRRERYHARRARIKAAGAGTTGGDDAV